MKIYKIRHANLLRILEEFAPKDLSINSGVALSTISSCSKKKKDGTYVRNIGEVTARKFEMGARKPSGWLDQPYVGGELDLDRNKAHNDKTVSHLDQNNLNFTVPLLNWKQLALFLENPDSFDFSEVPMIPSPAFMYGPNTFSVPMPGVSMATHDGIQENEICFIDPSRKPVIGNFVMAQIAGDKLTIKRLKEDELGTYLFATKTEEIIREFVIKGTLFFKGVPLV